MDDQEEVPNENTQETKPYSFPTKLQTGDFITLCMMAKDGEQEAVLTLYQILYPEVEDRLHFVDEVDRERFATEFLDRYLLGWVKPDNARGPKNDQKFVPPWIQDCNFNFKSFFNMKLNNFISERIGDYDRPPADEYRDEEEDDGDEVAEDFQGLADTGDFPGSLPRPDVDFMCQELQERCRTLLCKHYTPSSRIVGVFDMMLDEEPQTKMAATFNVDTSTIERDVATIRRMMKEFLNV